MRRRAGAHHNASERGHQRHRSRRRAARLSDRKTVHKSSAGDREGRHVSRLDELEHAPLTDTLDLSSTITRKALERERRTWLLSPMTENGTSARDESRALDATRSLVDDALTAGSLTTIATGGALVGLGRRAGETSWVFRLAGRGLLEQFGVSATAAPLTSVGVGYLHHIIIASAWGFVLALLILPQRGIGRVLFTLVAALLYVLLSARFVPAALRIGYSVTGNTASAVAIGVSLGVALLGAIWLSSTVPEGEAVVSS